MKIGIIREEKIPIDARVPLTPVQCAELRNKYQIDLVVQTSSVRCFSDEEYKKLGVPVVEIVTDCAILLGVKEVPIPILIPQKTYFFFSHTIKGQAHNRNLLKAVLEKQISLVDYEVLTNEKGERVIAFGHFAGLVGAYNGMMTYGKRTQKFELKRMFQCRDYEEAKKQFKKIELPPIKIVLTGKGRVAGGAAQLLIDMGIREVSPDNYLKKKYKRIVFTQLDCGDYAARIDGQPYQQIHFYQNPQLYKSIFKPYTLVSDLMMNGIFWDSRAPAFFTKEEMKEKDFKIKVIADITCDIAPESSIPSTLKASTIENPIFGYDPILEKETTPFQSHAIDMMTIDNLPNELPRDASEAFGKQFMQFVLPALLHPQPNDIIERGTIVQSGKLKERFSYLKEYVVSIKGSLQVPP